jgi:hypothetical protein
MQNQIYENQVDWGSQKGMKFTFTDEISYCGHELNMTQVSNMVHGPLFWESQNLVMIK